LTDRDKYIGAIYLLIRLAKIILQQKLNQYSAFMGNKSFLELKNLIFDKILKISPSVDINTGEIYNLVQIDSNKLCKLIINLPNIFSIPIIIVAYNYLLYKYIGISFIAGVVVMIIFLIINYYYRTQFSKYLKLHMKKSDSRINVTTEMINNLKTIKLNAWDDLAIKKIQEARGEELNALDMRYYVTTISQTLLWFAPIAMSIASIGFYQYLNDEFRIEDVFTSLGIFTSFKGLLRNLPNTLDVFVETLISLGRIEKFLELPEVNDSNIEKYDDNTMNKNIALQIKNGNFTWNKNYKPQQSKISEKLNINTHAEEEKELGLKKLGNSTNIRAGKFRRKTMMELEVPQFGQKKKNDIFSSEDEDSLDSGSSSNENSEEKSDNIINDDDAISLDESQKGVKAQKIYALKDINFTVKEGEFVCIIGEVGSGKSSLIQALLNNMIQINKDESRVIINGSISYVPQEAWIQNDTLRNNILFYLPFDSQRYYHILDICELKPDLDVLIGGDMTEIGEKGINLSGGQRARINIARALYNNKDIYIFDDPLSALDANVGKNIVRNCIKEY
jgi:ABC-type bacteriocin/lantibiotic exporter with double-glycine peptidase domain